MELGVLGILLALINILMAVLMAHITTWHLQLPTIESRHSEYKPFNASLAYFVQEIDIQSSEKVDKIIKFHSMFAERYTPPNDDSPQR